MQNAKASNTPRINLSAKSESTARGFPQQMQQQQQASCATFMLYISRIMYLVLWFWELTETRAGTTLN